MPRNYKLAFFDFGSYSTKVVSEYTLGAFLSAGAPIADESTFAFSPVRMRDSYDMRILNAKKRAEFNDDGVTGRWVIGEKAFDHDTVRRFTRDIRRFDDSIYRVLMCAALATAFPQEWRAIDKLEENGGKPKDSWRIPVKVGVSIAPGYWGNAEQLARAVPGVYDFVDMRNERFYTFRVTSALVCPESFGILATQLYTPTEDGYIEQRPAPGMVKGLVGVIDGGGRTTDLTGWRDVQIVEAMFDSLDTGIIQVADIIGKIANNQYPGQFVEKPVAVEIVNAIVDRNDGRTDIVRLAARDGDTLDITDIADDQMTKYARAIADGYKNKLRGGQGVNALIMGGGAAVALQPYLEDKIRHNNILFAGQTMEEMYMSNALGGYYYLCRMNQGERYHA